MKQGTRNEMTATITDAPDTPVDEAGKLSPVKV